ncbi:hypothetical protein Tco_0157378 [Tanacetum coccineum]
MLPTVLIINELIAIAEVHGQVLERRQRPVRVDSSSGNHLFHQLSLEILFELQYAVSMNPSIHMLSHMKAFPSSDPCPMPDNPRFIIKGGRLFMPTWINGMEYVSEDNTVPFLCRQVEWRLGSWVEVVQPLQVKYDQLCVPDTRDKDKSCFLLPQRVGGGEKARFVATVVISEIVSECVFSYDHEPLHIQLTS